MTTTRSLKSVLIFCIENKDFKKYLSSISNEIDDHIKKLPFKLLLPMMIFLIPAYLLLIFGPIVKLFIKGVWL